MTLLPFSGLSLPTLTEWFEILLLWIIYYHLLKLLRGTRGAQVLSGFAVTFIAVLSLTYFLNLYTLNWIFRTFSVNLVLAFVVIFQQEIRKALAELGRPGVLGSGSTRSAKRHDIIDPIAKAAGVLGRQKIGALIAIERDIGLKSVEQTGLEIDSKVKPELLTSLFFPRSPLHDGGVVIRGERVVAAGCVFPLSQREELHRSLGTRHRAAIGITEETDALVVVISEETGTISVAYKGRLSRGLDEDRLRRMMNTVLSRTSRKTQNADSKEWGPTDSEHGSTAR